MSESFPTPMAPDETAGTPGGVVVAPLFDGKRALIGIWLEYQGTPDLGRACIDRIATHADTRSERWLFVLDRHAGAPPETLADTNPKQVWVRGARHAEQPPPPAPWQLGLRAATASELAHATAAWRIVAAPAGAVDAAAGAWLADGLANWTEAEPLAELGWSAFLFDRNRAVSGKKNSSERMALMRLLGLVTSDAETEALEELFKHEPRLAFDLLKLVNSSALNLRAPANNFRHAITLLGRRQLQRWLQLLLFARQGDAGKSNILLWHSASRGRIMELLAIELGWDADIVDQAFMAGVFSLLDVLMDASLASLLSELSLPERIMVALLERRDALGELLALAAAIEQRDCAAVARLAAAFALAPVRLLDAQLASLTWTEALASAT